MADEVALSGPADPAFSVSSVRTTRARIDTHLARAAGGFGTLFAAQAIPRILEERATISHLWEVCFAVAFLLTLAIALVAAIVQRGVSLTMGLVAGCYLAGLVTWPFALTGGAYLTDSTHWLYLFLTVSITAAVIAFPPRVAVLFVFLAPAAYAADRITASRATVPWQNALLDSVFAIIIAGAVLLIATMVRHAASAVDSAQSAALRRYSLAVREHATEVERGRIDSIVHDNVLVTLLTAATASTPEAQRMAAVMAGNAIHFLQSSALAGPRGGGTISMVAITARITGAAAALGEPFDVTTSDFGGRTVPAAAAEAIGSAATQAMTNSVQHAGSAGVRRWLSIDALGSTGIEVCVGDDGAGFVHNNVAAARIGLRVSIMERMRNAGGEAHLETAPGTGTVVTLRWPSPDAAADASEGA